MVHSLVVMITKNDKVTFPEFKDILENDWVPLLEKICGPLFPLTYVRRYIAHEGNDEQRKREGPLGLPALIVGKKEEIPWHCLIETTFEDDLHLQQFFSLINEEEPAEQLLACESTFSDLSKLRIIVMDSKVSVNKSRKLKTWE